MPYQNRVDPWGQLHAIASRGTLLGNRGQLHDESRRVARAWARLPWVTCALQHDGIRRTVFGPNTYSELFFLDEATAFAAGHRPCASCRRQRYLEFKSTWLEANRGGAPASTPIAEIDKVLHGERLTLGGQKVTFEATLAELPVGTFIEAGGNAVLVGTDRLLKWSFDRYRSADPIALPTRVRVLTPASVVRTFQAGLRPDVHASAQA